MQFIEPTLDTIVSKLEQLHADSKPLWGQMSAQRMVEHLTDTFILCRGNHSIPLQIPADKVQRAQDFLKSDAPMPKDFNAIFAPSNEPIRNSNFTEAIEELKTEWTKFIAFFEGHNNQKTLHPYFGELDFELWKRMHSKHITHHLEQFSISI